GPQHGPVRQAAGPRAAPRRVLRLLAAGRAAAPLRARLARQPPRAEAARDQRAGVLAGAAPRCGRLGGQDGARSRRARRSRGADRAAPGQARPAAALRARAGHLGQRRGATGGDRAQAGRVLRGDLGGGRAPVPDGPLPRARRKSRPDGGRAVRPRGEPAEGPSAHEPARAAAAPPPRSLRMIALLAALLAAGAAEPGLALLREGRPAEAAESFAAALRKDPRNAALANDLGLAHARAGNREEAERAYRLAIQLNPGRWYAYGNLAELLSTAPHRWDRAGETLALLERGLARTSPAGRIDLALRVADFERSVGRTAQARQRLAQLDESRLDPARIRRARELLERIADDERARTFEDWPEAAPSPGQIAALAAGERKLAAKDPRGALADATALCAAQPAWRAAHWLRARCLESTGQLDEEARELRILTQL